MPMADYAFYTDVYLGSAIPEKAFPGMALRAREVLNRFQRSYQVTVPGEDSLKMAICAMAESLYAQTILSVDTIDASQQAIIYTCKTEGNTKYILSVNGMGLWGPIWGYIALNSDKQTVYGAYFNHASETAGLGAEIKDSKAWQDLFKGKQAIIDGKVVLSVKKSTDIKPEERAYCVDGVTGSTLTCNGVDMMLEKSIALYSDFLNEK